MPLTKPMTDRERLEIAARVLDALTVALTPSGHDPTKTYWTDLPRLAYELQAEVRNSQGMLDAVLRHRPTTGEPS